MKYIIEVDDNSNSGKSLVEIARRLSRESRSIEFLKEKELQRKEDEAFGKIIMEARKGRNVSAKDVTARLTKIKKALKK